MNWQGSGRTRFAMAALAVSSSFLAAPVDALAQPTKPVYRLGILNAIPRSDPNLAAFFHRLHELGYAEGNNIRVEQPASGTYEARAAELVQRQVDVIFAVSDQPIRAAKATNKTIPMVMVGCDAVAAGLIDSLHRPGGNLTGVSCNSAEVAAKRLQLLRDIVPRLARVAVLYNHNDLGKQAELRLTETAARSLGLAMQTYGLGQGSDIEGAFAAMQRDDVGGLIVMGDALTFANRQVIADHAAKYKLPAAYAFREHADAGGLFTYGPNLAEMFRTAAGHVDRVLKGAKPADLPVEEPTKFELVVNLKAAKALGITIPKSVLLRADEVIE